MKTENRGGIGMKKWTIGLLMMALVIALGATSAFAAGWGGRYADADGDGICDNAGARTGGRRGFCGGRGK